MDRWVILPTDAGFAVAAVSADAEERLIDGFASEQDAQDWSDARRTSNLWAAELFGLTPNH